MFAALLPIAWLAPLLLLPLAVRDGGKWLTAVAVLPALIAASVVPTGTAMELPWLLLGISLELDTVGRMLMSFSALLWMFAGVYALLNEDTTVYDGRFRLFFLLSLAGGNPSRTVSPCTGTKKTAWQREASPSRPTSSPAQS